MKKNFLISILALGAASMMLTGFDNNVTVEEVLEKYSEAAAAAPSFSADASINVDILASSTVEGEPTQTSAITVLGSLDIAMSRDPLSLSADSSVSVDTPDEKSRLDLQVYAVPGDDGGFDLNLGYKEDSEIGWVCVLVPAEEMEKISAIFEGSTFDPSNLIGTYTLGETPVEVDGTTCYQVINTLTYDDLRVYMDKAAETAGQDDAADSFDILGFMLNNLVLNIEIDIDVNTYLPVKMHMDMDGSDFSLLSTMLAFQAATTNDDGSMNVPEVSLDIKELYAEAVYDYSSPVDIIVPEAAQASKAQGNTIDWDTFVDALMSSMAGM